MRDDDYMTTNANEEAARERKAQRLAPVVAAHARRVAESTGATTAEVHAALRSTPQVLRDSLAEEAGTRSPSPHTWNRTLQVVWLLLRTPEDVQVREGSRGESNFVVFDARDGKAISNVASLDPAFAEAVAERVRSGLRGEAVDATFGRLS